MKKTIVRTLSVLAIGGIVLWGAKSLAGGEMNIDHKAVCRAILGTGEVRNTPEETEDIALVTQTETSHNVWEPDAGVATFSGDYRDGGCTFSCREGYVRDAEDEECKLDVPPAGVYHNTGAGTITVSDGTTTYTIMDKNLGATVAGTGKINGQGGCSTTNNGTTCRSESIGDYFQRGNNYGFANQGEVIPNSTTLVENATRPYSDNRWIYGMSSPYDRIKPQNNDLRGGSINDGPTTIPTGQDALDRQGPCPDGYHVPSMGEWNQLLITRASIKGVSLNDNGGYKGFSAEANVTQFRNDFRLPLAGRRLNSSAASVSSQGSYGRYWSSSPDGTSAYSLNLLSSNLNTYGSNYRAYGFSLRCFQNS